jgi:hypothetical protein
MATERCYQWQPQMTRVIVLRLPLLLAAALCSCTGSNAISSGSGRRERLCTNPKIDVRTKAIVPLFDLIERPEKYEGCRVTTSGFFNIVGATGGELYLTEHDLLSRGLLFGPIRLELLPHTVKLTLEGMQVKNGSFLFVTGIVATTPAGTILKSLEEFDSIDEDGKRH